MGLPAFKFDTLAFVKSLREAGVDEKQAEVYAENQAQVIQMLQEEQLVTKDDIRDLQISIKESEASNKLELTKLQQGIAALDEKMQHNVKEIQNAIQLGLLNLENKLGSQENRLFMKLVGSITAIMIALLTFFQLMHVYHLL